MILFYNIFKNFMTEILVLIVFHILWKKPTLLANSYGML